MIGGTRYGPAKCALSYFTHSLRMELSPRFGIWCSAIEPAAFATPITSAIKSWTDKAINEAKENNPELLDIYKREMKRYQNFKWEDFPNVHYKLDKVVNSIVHAINAKYPEREYMPGTEFFIWQLFLNMPIWMVEYLTLSDYAKRD
eukprot:103398_1